MRRFRSACRRFAGLAIAALIATAPPPATAQPQDTPERRKFLVIYANQSTLLANVEATRGLTEQLNAELGGGFEVYAEYRDAQRFPGTAEDTFFVRRLRARYEGFEPDAILAMGSAALQVVQEQHAMLGSQVPVIFGGFSTRHYDQLVLPPGYFGLTNAYDARGTVALARSLQPEARRLVVYAGNGPQDELWKSIAMQQLSTLDGLDFSLVTDLTLDGFRDHAAALEDDTILLVLTIFKDAAGTDYTPAQAAGAIASAAGVPTYGVYDTYIDNGLTGGAVDTFDDFGAAMAETALRVLAGEPVPAQSLAPTRRVVNWHQIERFGIKRDTIPPGTEIRYYTPSVWEDYAAEILMALAVILAQSATIAALVIQNNRRRQSEAELSRQRLEMAHLGRVAQMGEISGALAHELNQPLTSILANAEAGARMITRNAPDLGEVAEIFDDIATEDRRAARIISDLRRLMSRGESDFEPLELNAVVRSTLGLAAPEFDRRNLRIDARLAKDSVAILGNRGQVQQVVLNLLMNAAEAMSDRPDGPGGPACVVLTTRRRDDGMAELDLRDFGPGLAPDVDPFRPFATTKSYGMGLGLPICRTIAEAHGGRLTLAPAEGGGTLATFEVPAA